MKLQTRALYNLVRFGALEDPTLPAEPWQVEDLRTLPEEELFERLKKFGIKLDKQHFIAYTEQVDSPEELTEILCDEEREEKSLDQLYLLLFELWRRLVPDKQSLSIFCDELDRLFFLYDQDRIEEEEPLQEALSELEHLLDQGVDQGKEPEPFFLEVMSYCAHDASLFVRDYILDQILRGETLYASELIDGFNSYLPYPKWFAFFRSALLFETEEEEAMAHLEGLLEQADLELLLAIADFLSRRGDPRLFVVAIRRARALIALERDFQELLALSCQFCQLFGKEKASEVFEKLLADRQDRSFDQALDPADPVLATYDQLVEEL